KNKNLRLDWQILRFRPRAAVPSRPRSETSLLPNLRRGNFGSASATRILARGTRMSATRRAVQGAWIALVGLFAISTANAQQLMLSKESYLPAPKEIADVLATRGDLVTLTNLSPDGKKFLVAKNDGMPSITRLGCPHVILGEVAFDHLANRAHDLWVRSNSGFDLFFVADKRTVPVQA